MSIRSKDLSYDKSASQPAFLQRLRDQNAGITASGRHERPVARPQRLRNNQDEDEDAPTYVVEGSSEVISRAEYEKLTSGAEGEDAGDVETKFGDVKDMVTGELQSQSPKASGALPSDEKDSETKASRSSTVVDAGKAASKKRKVAKVVGGDDDEDEEGEKDKASSNDKAKRKVKKKGKAIKLSFGDDE